MLSEKIRQYQVKKVKKDLVMEFGDQSDGAVEFIAKVVGGSVETAYFYGDSKPKNIIVASTQVGCPSKCNFCELGEKAYVKNLSADEILDQVILMLQQADRYGHNIDKVKHKINWAKSGDALLNEHYVSALENLADLEFSHKLCSVFPAGRTIAERFIAVADFASTYTESFQVQLSLISTSEIYRQKAAGIRTASFQEIRNAADYWRNQNPEGRKVNLSLIVDGGNPIDTQTVVEDFPPGLFRFRFRNYVPTENGSNHGLEQVTEQRFDEIYRMFQDKGYEVGTWASPTPMEVRFGLAANVTLRRYEHIIAGRM
tara:strand:- start:580 stop:1521 length:942 start_codon:yes stop_codon:yes gene_type:complete